MTRFALLLLACGCTTKPNPSYCDLQTPCKNSEQTCDLVARECVALLPDLSINDLPDMSTMSIDIALAPDLQEPDLQPPPDLQAPPDLQEPDLQPPPWYFNPDVQTKLLNAGGGGGCAKSGNCHNASDGKNIPFLIPTPSTAPAVHANYVAFTGETEQAMLNKIVASSGSSHGGTMVAGDRKPCSTSAAEPCASLIRWYANGAPENAP